MCDGPNGVSNVCTAAGPDGTTLDPAGDMTRRRYFKPDVLKPGVGHWCYTLEEDLDDDGSGWRCQ